MRTLTRAEVLVIRSLLGSNATTQKARILQSGLPTRTFEVARQRVFAAGWVIERYVPDPVAIGVPRITFALAKPYAEQLFALSRKWQALEGNVLLWRTPQTLFGVFLGSGEGTLLSRQLDFDSTELYSQAWSLEVDLRFPTVPVYFDFEGAWARIAGLAGTSTYPRSLHSRDMAERVPLSRSLIEAVGEVAASTFVPPYGRTGRGMFRLGPRRSTISRVLERGLIMRRVFLEPSILPGYLDWRLHRIVMVHGKLRTGRHADDLFKSLVGRCEVTPFLFATDQLEVLLGAMSPPPPSSLMSPSPSRESVLGTLQAYLTAIEVHRESVQELEVMQNHRYARLLVDLAA